MQIPLEVFGFIGGKIVRTTVINRWVYKKIGKFNINISGLENLDKIDNSYVLAANHIKPGNRGLLQSGVSADSFIISKVILEQTGRHISLSTNYLLELPFFLKLPLQIYMRGFVKGLGYIPVGQGKKDFHNVFLESVKNNVAKKRPILIYPVGAQLEDFDDTQELKAGAGYIASKYNLPIIPTYIKGGRDWGKEGEKVYLVFGKPINCSNLTIDEINAHIKKGILKLKDQVNASSSMN